MGTLKNTIAIQQGVTLGIFGKRASMERQNSNGLIKNFKRECQSENVCKALRITYLLPLIYSAYTTNTYSNMIKMSQYNKPIVARYMSDKKEDGAAAKMLYATENPYNSIMWRVYELECIFDKS